MNPRALDTLFRHTLCMKKALLIIATNGFQDVELKAVRDALIAADFAVELASSRKGQCTGKFGSTEEALYGFEEIDLGNFDRVCFIGGPGAVAMADDAIAQHLTRSIVRSGKPLGAICIAPTILAKGGVLKGGKATVWDDGKGTQIDLLERCGAFYADVPVVVDGLIVTGNGPEAAVEFGKTFAALAV